MKKDVSQKVAGLALRITKMNVNSFCMSIFYQPKLPRNCEKLSK